MDKNNLNVAVVGAGIIGVTVAKLLQEQLRNASITIVADKFKNDTTSAVAAGIFTPRGSFRAQNEHTTKIWIKDSWDYWQNIEHSSDAPLAGVTSLSSYIFSKNNPDIVRNHMLENLLPIYRPATANELKLCPGDWKYGSFYKTLQIESKIYLPWAENIFRSRGGSIRAHRIHGFNELDGYDLVFNCTGLGAKALCKDHDLIPIRGQVIKVKAPWIKTAFYGDIDTYIIPCFNGIVTLGGTRQYDSYNLDYCKHDAAAIMERCTAMLPSLAKAEVVEHKVGLRPHRTPVRVEPELMEGGRLKVVHCYGHGGYGVTTSPGTAKYAINIALDLLKGNSKAKI